MIVVAFDLSLTASGWADASGVGLLVPPGSADRGIARLRWIRDAVLDRVTGAVAASDGTRALLANRLADSEAMPGARVGRLARRPSFPRSESIVTSPYKHEESTAASGSARRYLGTIRIWDFGRPFGFIEADERVEGDADGRHSIFVHGNAIVGGRQRLLVGDRVSFGLERTSRGLRAVDVTVLNGSPTQL